MPVETWWRLHLRTRGEAYLLSSLSLLELEKEGDIIVISIYFISKFSSFSSEALEDH
jgi:hypothetical protein